jgi:hypothetical protein
VDPQQWQPADPDAAPSDASSLKAAVLLSTTFEIPGFITVAFHGEVFGLVVRSRNVVSNVGANAHDAGYGSTRGQPTPSPTPRHASPRTALVGWDGDGLSQLYVPI